MDRWKQVLAGLWSHAAGPEKAPLSALRNVSYGPIRHEALPADLVSRIRLIRAALLEVRPNSMQHWLGGFQRDEQPEGEIALWEHIAACFLEYCAMNPALTATQRQAAFSVVFLFSMSMDEKNDPIKNASAELPDGALDMLKHIYAHSVPAYDFADQSFPSGPVIPGADSEKS